MTEKEHGEISRREFLKDAGFVVGGAAIGAGITYPLVSKDTVTETKTVEVAGPTKTVPTTVEVPGATKTVEVPGPTKTVEVPGPTKTVTVEVPITAPSKGHLVHNPDICSGCRTCEIVCSLSKEGAVNPELARIHVSTDRLGGYISEVMSCKQCDGPECLLACPIDALHVDAVTGARVIDEKKCIGCKLCMEACPATPSRIRFNTAKNVCFKCDLCGGEPQCVKFCPYGALTFVKEEV